MPPILAQTVFPTEGSLSMPIVIKLNQVMAERKIRSKDLAELVGTSQVNLSNIKNGHIKGMRFSLLESLCQVLRCRPGDLIDYVSPEEAEAAVALGEIRERNYE